MQLSELSLDRQLYRDNDQSSETQDASFVSADSSDLEVSSIPSGGAAQDINTSNTKIDGAQLEPGTYPLTILDVANWGWGQTCLFSSTDDDTVSWGAGTFTSADGTSYSISAGNTGAMTQKTYIYLSLLESETVYQATTTPSDAVGLGKVLVAVAEDADDDATFMLSEASQIIGDNIMANSINASKIVTGSVTTAQLNFTPLYSSDGTGSIIATINASGETLNISAAKINISGSTTFSAGYDPTTKITEGGAATDINSYSTTITGNKIRTGEIESYGYSYSSGNYSSVGMQIDLDNGMIRSPKFAVDTLGNAYFKGELIASSGYIGGWKINSTSIYTGTEDHSGYTSNAGDMTIYSNGSNASIHASKFYIDSSGILNCTSANIGSGSSWTGNQIANAYIGNLVATKITSGVLSVGGTSQPSAITIYPSSSAGTGTTTSVLNWKNSSSYTLGKIWTDSLGYMGYNAIGGKHYFYTSNYEYMVMEYNKQAIFNYGISCRKNFNVTSAATSARFEGIPIYLNTGTGATCYIQGGSEIDYLSPDNHVFYSGGTSYADAIIDENIWTNGSLYADGDVDVDGDVNADGTKNFLIDHPDGSGKLLRYTAQESPEVILRHRGKAKTDSTGKVTITLPTHFTLITEKDGDVTVNLTPIGNNHLFLQEEPTNSEIKVECDNPNVSFHYEVMAIRKGYLDYTVEIDPEDKNIKTEDKATVEKRIDKKKKKTFKKQKKVIQ